MPTKIHGKVYSHVSERIHAVHTDEVNLGCSVKTQLEYLKEPEGGPREVLIKATVIFERDGIAHTFDGHAQEYETKSGVNSTSFIENAETSAVGRALAFAGLGGESIASAEEVKGAIETQDAKAAQGIEDKARVEAMGVAMKSYRKVESELEDMGLPRTVFWEAFSLHTKTIGRDNVSLHQWKQLNVDLISGSFGNWIHDAVATLAREQEEQEETQLLLGDEHEGDGKASPAMRGMADRDKVEEPESTLEDRKEERHARTLDNPNS